MVEQLFTLSCVTHYTQILNFLQTMPIYMSHCPQLLVHCNFIFSLIHPCSGEQTLHWMEEFSLVMAQEQSETCRNKGPV